MGFAMKKENYTIWEAWPFLAIFSVFLVSSMSLSLCSGPGKGQSLETYIGLMQKGKKKELSQEQWEMFLEVEAELGQRMVDIEMDNVTSKGMIEIGNSGGYVSKSRYEVIKKRFKKMGLDIDDAVLVRINGHDGEQLVDIRYKESPDPCFALEPAKAPFERANAAYFKRAKKDMRVNSCWRSRNRQIASKLEVVYPCLTKKGYFSKKRSFEEEMDYLRTVSDIKLKACMTKTAKGDNPVGGILTSKHAIGDGFDIADYKRAKKELDAVGFVCGLKSGYFSRSDQNHCVPKK